MSYLLDSHVLLWWLEDSPLIGSSIREKIADPEVRVLVSAASVWEIGIKQALGKLRAPESLIRTRLALNLSIVSEYSRHVRAANRTVSLLFSASPRGVTMYRYFILLGLTDTFLSFTSPFSASFFTRKFTFARFRPVVLERSR